MKSSAFLRLALAAALTAGSAAACGDPYEVEAIYETAAETVTVYALTGSPPEFPSGLSTILGGPRRVDASLQFDVAFDLAADGRVVLYPVKLIAQPYGAPRNVGIQVVATPYADLLRAPRRGYESDSATTVAPGQAVALEVTSPNCSFYDRSDRIYTKLVVDSVDTATRAIWLRLVTNPNCGFLSFRPGIPND